MPQIHLTVSYDQAIDQIAAHAYPVSSEAVSLVDALHRISATEVSAISADPGYDQSLRDGFVIGKGGLLLDNGTRSYRVMGEIPAGRCDAIDLGDGEAYRIMTGGLVPAGGERVIQQEDCIQRGDVVDVPGDVLSRPPRYIQGKGSVIAREDQIVGRGTLLSSRDIGLLATTGNHELEVYRKVSVSFFCTGSELVTSDAPTVAGQKISSNRYLLDALIRSNRAVPVDWGIARDCRKELERLISRLIGSGTDIIISTGGVGPGKYDLLKTAFEQIGGELIYHSIAMRPGQSTLFGLVAGKLYFGLPGPPSAVGMLFNELVLPALRQMQGLRDSRNRDSKAVLDRDISLGNSPCLCIRQGILFSRDQIMYVRQCRKNERPNCNILFKAGTDLYRKGEIISVHHYFQQR